MKLIHDTNHIDTQIENSPTQFITMKNLIERLPADDEIAIFCQNKKGVKNFNNCYSVESYKKLGILMVYLNALFKASKFWEILEYNNSQDC